MRCEAESFSVSGDFTAYIQEYDRGRIERILVEWVGSPLTIKDAITLLAWNENFIDFLSSLLTQRDMDGFVWEMPPLTQETLRHQFEFVVIDTRAPYHDEADFSPFASCLSEANANAEVLAFENLGGDALLIVPTPVEGADYRDLGHFLSTATKSHIHGFWKTVAETVTVRVSDQPVRVSVAGEGVAWLHLRLDTQPKYYQYLPYLALA